MSLHIRALRHIRRLIDRETANTLACSIVATRLDYCSSVLSGITAKNITRLQRVQNSLAQVVCCAPYRSPSRPMLKSLHWLPVEYRIQQKIATLTFKVRFHHLPNYLHQLITTYTPSRLLRSSDSGLLAVPRTSTTTAARAFRVTAPRIWNSLPETIHSAHLYLNLPDISSLTCSQSPSADYVTHPGASDSPPSRRIMAPLYKSLID